MTPLWLAVHYLAARPWLNLLTALGVAVGVALVVAITALSGAARRSAQETAGGYQLLVTAKGSPVQAVLSTLFFAEAPTGNIPLEVYEQLRADPGVAFAVPFNFGDSYRGHFVVGTTGEYLKLVEESVRRPVRFVRDGRWPQAPFEAAVGAAAAAATGLKTGDRFVAEHGFVELPKELAHPHDDNAYTVVGVMQPLEAPADRAIFTTLETAWIVHASGPARRGSAERNDTAGKGSEITAVLVHGKGYGDVARLSAWLARRPDVQALFPGRVATQLLSYLQRGQTVASAMAWLAAGLATFAITISLLAAAIERRRQIAMLRAIGASRAVVFGTLAGEAGLIAGGGAVAGVVLGRALAQLLALHLAAAHGLHLHLGPLGLEDLWAALGAVALGLAAGAIPAYVACREDVAKNLASPV